MKEQEIVLETTSDNKPVELKISPQRTAILVISMQNEFCSPGGEASVISNETDMSQSTRKPAEAIKAICTEARKAGSRIIHCLTGFRPDLADVPKTYLEKHAPKGEGAAIGSNGPHDNKSHVSGSRGR